MARGQRGVRGKAEGTRVSRSAFPRGWDVGFIGGGKSRPPSESKRQPSGLRLEASIWNNGLVSPKGPCGTWGAVGTARRAGWLLGHQFRSFRESFGGVGAPRRLPAPSSGAGGRGWRRLPQPGLSSVTPGSGAEPERPPPPLSRSCARRGHHDPADPRRRPGLETAKRTGPGEGELGRGGARRVSLGAHCVA